MKNSFVTDLYNKIVKARLASPIEIKGCSINEINILESKIGLKLPKLYKNFLLKFGHGAGEFFLGTDIFYNELLSLGDIARELLEEDGGHYCMPINSFVFSSHQGYQFTFFDLSNYKDDPEVFYYKEGMNKPKKMNDTFSEFLIESLREHIEMKEMLEKM